MNESVIDLTLVSAILIWEILHFLGLNSWVNDNFNLDICIKLVESSKSLASKRFRYVFNSLIKINLLYLIKKLQALFLKRLISELSKIINDDTSVALSAKYTIIFYKIFAMFSIIIEKSTTKILKNCLRENYQEEFK